MSIEVKHITKLYGAQKALHDVSFRIEPGQIAGLLGPNGAGKSTMMKILTCFLPPDAGTATVHGHDVMEDSIEVRRLVGYLPENNPLYLEMYVREYLEFVGGIYKIPHLKKRVDEMIDLTGIAPERKKKIGALSKGFRQRVGLAQALIHDPKVLILDEPTSGLDPNQLKEIRNLIKKIGSEKTVILSTHIMQEVEAICDRAIIINKGEIVADDSTANLHRLRSDEESFLVEFSGPVTAKNITALKNVHKAENIAGNTWLITASGKEDVRPQLFQLAVAEKLTVLSLQKQQHTLEEIFQDLTRS
ncbi:MAG: gliding motility-associated ABC transporter ATP-binding subunit GldA [Bacteroidales bacterium]